MRHTKPKTTNHRVKHMYQRCHVINAISTSQGKYLQCSCDQYDIFGICCHHILVVCDGKIQVDMIHFTFWRKYQFFKARQTYERVTIFFNKLALFLFRLHILMHSPLKIYSLLSSLFPRGSSFRFQLFFQ